MKLLLLLILMTMTVGCSLLFIPTFDGVEYQDAVQLTVESSQGGCTVEHTQKMTALSTHLVYYSAYLPHNTLIHEGARDMHQAIQSLHLKVESGVPVGGTYCTLTLRTIHQMAKTLTERIGHKPR
jgi:hypothetical protein